jgi:hypothetical protein
MESKKISQLTVGELIDIEFEAFKNCNRCRLSLVQIAKRFLSSLLDIDVYKLDFDSIRSAYIESSGRDKISLVENGFYLEISQRYLYLVHEPKEKLLELFYIATDDLKNINSQLSYIDSENERLINNKKKNGRLNGEERYYKNQLEYYKDKNMSAKEEILEFISCDIEFYAVQKCKKDLMSSLGGLTMFFTGSMPYRYSRGLMFNAEFDQYDVRNMTEMSNKFLDLPVGSHREIKELYENDKDKFYLFAKEYISGDMPEFKNALDKIRGFIKSSHIVGNRKEVLNTIIMHYERKDFLSVVNMLPLQVEGMFHDVCLAIGIDESRLDIASINEKLRIIQSHFNQFIYFEYYSFKFPVMRNMVAHGKLVEGNLEHTAIMLMLDLLPVCEFSLSEEIPINKKIKLLKEIGCDKFESLIEMFEYIDTEISSFYRLDKEYELALTLYESDKFWEYLESLLKKEKLENLQKSKVMRFIKKLNATKLAKEKSTNFLKKMPDFIGSMKKEEAERKKRLEPFLKALKAN